MMNNWPSLTVAQLQKDGILLVEDGNHGENRPRPNEFATEGLSFIRASDMDNGEVLFYKASFINEVAARRIRKGIGAKGDVLLSHKGTVGKVALVREDAPDFVCSPQTTFWRSQNQEVLDRRFLYYYLTSENFRSQLDSRKGETDMAPYVSLTAQRQLTIPLIPIESQRYLVRIVGALDDKIEINRQLNATLEQLARTLFQSWFVNFDPVRAKASGEPEETICRRLGLTPDLLALFPAVLEESAMGEIPLGWEMKSLPEIVDINPKRSIIKAAPAPYLDMANVPAHSARVNNVITRPFSSGSKFINGDTLLARITPCLENGKTAYVDFLEENQIGWGSTEFIVMRPKSPLPTEFGYLLARHPAFRDFAIANMEGTSGRQRVPNNCFVKYFLAMPSREVAIQFGNIVKPLMHQIKQQDEESRTLAALRDELLPRLLSGELPVSEIIYGATEASL